MLSIYSKSSGGFCDGVSRRISLKIGGLAMGVTKATLTDLNGKAQYLVDGNLPMTELM
jgi:hypothetical protein